MHQAMAMSAWLAVLAPVEVCSIHSPRIVSMIGVNGWRWANACSTVGIVCAGTKAVLR